MTEATSVYFSMIQIYKLQIEAKKEMHSDHSEMIINSNRVNIEASNNKDSTKDLLIKNIVKII